MASLTIREWRTSQHNPTVGIEPGRDQPALTISSSKATSAAFSPSAKIVTISADVAFHYAVGDSPNVTTNSLRIPANTPWTFGLSRNGMKVAVIEAA